MIDHALDQVEDPEAHQHRAYEQLTGPAYMRAVRLPPQYDEPEQDEDVGAGMEEAVPERIDFEVEDTVGRVAGAGEHVMPLEHLMQDDPVEEAAQAEPEEDTAGRREIPVFARVLAHPILLKVCFCSISQVQRSHARTQVSRSLAIPKALVSATVGIFGAGLSETVMKQFLRLNIRQKLVNYGSKANMIIYRR